jgi:isopentenyl-diphosphate delta-isomerase
LTEHEFDHVMIGYYDENPVINPEEAGRLEMDD